MLDFDIQPKMVGRDEEIRKLKNYLEKAEEREGNTIFIPGEAGVGKTRLVNELKEFARSKGFHVLSGNSSYESLVPYMPFIEALRSGGFESLFAEETPRVEAVYLMTHGGMLIKDFKRHETELNPDIFASMLTAVGNFVKESLSKLSGEEKEGALNTLGYHNYRIIIESRQNTNLVIILIGKENEFLINDMREILSKAINEYGNVLTDWDGEEKHVEGIEKILQPLITSGKYDGIYYGKEDPKARRNLLFENVSMGLIRQAQKSPTLLCIEDLQWADPSTLALMHYIARNTKNCGLLILGTYRPEDIAVIDGKGHPLVNTMQLMNREDLHEKMELERLPRGSIDDFLDSLLGKNNFSGEFKNRIFKETEGNPLFIIQLMKFLVEEKIVQALNDVWKLTINLEDIHIPPKVYNVIERRLDRVEKEYRKVLDYASVIGETFSSKTLASALNQERVQVLEQLREIEHKHRLIHPLNGNYKFDHAKIKEVLYEEIPKDSRMEYHSTIANSIEELSKDNLDEVIGELAFHYYNCKDREKALFYLLKAAEKAKKEYSNEEAIRFYTQALEFEENEQNKIKIFENLGAVYDLIGNFDKSVEMYNQALELASNRETEAEINAKLGSTYEHRGEFPKAITLCCEALDIIMNTKIEKKTISNNESSYTQQVKSEYDKLLEHLEKSLKNIEKHKDQKLIAMCLNTIGFSFYGMGNFLVALNYLQKALPIWEYIKDQWGLSLCYKHIGATQSKLGNLDSAIYYLSKAFDIGEKIGNQSVIIHCLGERGHTYLWKLEFDKAIEDFNYASEIGKKIGDQWVMAASTAGFGATYLKMGEYDNALCYLEKSTVIDKAINFLRGLCFNYCWYAEAFIGKGDLENAQEYCDKVKALSDELDLKELNLESMRIQGIIYREQNRWDESIEAFEKCIDIFNNMKIENYYLGETYYNFALMWKAKGEPENAKTNFRNALDIFQKLRSEKYVEKVQAELKSLQT